MLFVHPDDAAVYNEWDIRASEVAVATHELLGHGSGKLFTEDADGKRNFDADKVTLIDLVTQALSNFKLALQITNPLTGLAVYACTDFMHVYPADRSQRNMVQVRSDAPVCLWRNRLSNGRVSCGGRCTLL